MDEQPVLASVGAAAVGVIDSGVAMISGTGDAVV
jgi:hypothetical protein